MVLRALAGGSGVPPEEVGTPLVAAVYAAGRLVVPVLGALIVSLRPGNALGWVFCAIGLATGMEAAAEGYAVYALYGEPGAAGGLWAAWTADWIWTFGTGLLPFVFLLFPDGRLPSRRWLPLAVFAGTLYLALPVGYALLPGPLGSFPALENPVGHGGGDGQILPGVDQVLAWLALVLAILLSVLSLVLRYRRSVGMERQQIKWVAYAAALLALYIIADVFFQEGLSPAAPVLDTLLAGVFYAAIGVAILRHRLYDVDLLINRTLVYAALSGMLAAIYLALVVVLQYGLRTLGGGDSQLAVVASTLVIAALFNPLRRRVQALVDRRFYRGKYDAGRVLGEFSARLREETDLDALREGSVGVVRRTVRPEHVSLWLAPARGGEDHGG